jgi:hypothetical protein
MLAGAQVIISLVVGLSVLALVAGVRAVVASGEPVDHLQQFMDTSSGASLTLRELEMRATFYQRALRPCKGWGAWLLKGTSRSCSGNSKRRGCWQDLAWWISSG